MIGLALYILAVLFLCWVGLWAVLIVLGILGAIFQPSTTKRHWRERL